LVTEQNELKKYEQVTNNKIVALKQENSKAESRLSGVNRTMRLLEKDIGILSQKTNARLQGVTPTENKPINEPVRYATLLPNSKVGWWIIWGATFLIVLLWMPQKPKKVKKETPRQEPVVNLSADNDLKNEYDFLNSQEGMPAKLNLARAYIDMQDYPSAEQVL